METRRAPCPTLYMPCNPTASQLRRKLVHDSNMEKKDFVLKLAGFNKYLAVREIAGRPAMGLATLAAQSPAVFSVYSRPHAPLDGHSVLSTLCGFVCDPLFREVIMHPGTNCTPPHDGGAQWDVSVLMFSGFAGAEGHCSADEKLVNTLNDHCLSNVQHNALHINGEPQALVCATETFESYFFTRRATTVRAPLHHIASQTAIRADDGTDAVAWSGDGSPSLFEFIPFEQYREEQRQSDLDENFTERLADECVITTLHEMAVSNSSDGLRRVATARTPSTQRITVRQAAVTARPHYKLDLSDGEDDEMEEHPA
eukprot:Selendium_serpulae@DN3604_c0_g1_i2.p1